MTLSQFQCVKLSHLPTPIEPLPTLSKILGGPQIYVKRDDCTGLAMGGNKVRKLEFLVGDALGNGCDTLLTVGGLQSNHARQTAAAAAKLGLQCELFLEDIPHTPREMYRNNGNILLDRLMGAVIHTFPAGTDLMAALKKRAVILEKDGRKPYEIPLGGSSAIGALGYTNCAAEIKEQCHEQDLAFDYIVLATGSCGTQGGLLAGLAMQKMDIPVIGINVSAKEGDQIAKLRPITNECCDLLDIAHLSDEKLICNGDYFYPGYGVPNEGTLEALKMLARHEALLLDPVYTGKGMAGLIDLVRQNFFKPTDVVLFLHTGGQAALFPYEPVISSNL